MLTGRVQDAVNAYVQALRADPSDQDSKRNLELALRLMQEQQQQQQKQQSGQDGERNEENEQNPSSQPPQPQQDGQQQQPPQPRPGKMSEEDARRILEALREGEREGVKKHARAVVPQTRRPEKDW